MPQTSLLLTCPLNCQFQWSAAATKAKRRRGVAHSRGASCSAGSTATSPRGRPRRSPPTRFRCSSTLLQTMRIVGTLFLVIFTFPANAIAAVPLLIGIAWIFRAYISISRQEVSVGDGSVSQCLRHRDGERRRHHPDLKYIPLPTPPGNRVSNPCPQLPL